MSSCLVPLDAAGGLPSAEIGGKAVGLAALCAHGFHVPEGVVVTTQVFAEVARSAGLLESPEAFDEASLAVRYRRARKVFLEAAIEPDLQRRIVAAAEHLLARGGRLIVRSSANLEDSPTASFAGMLETVAGVESAQGALDAIRCCWTSAFRPRVTRYLHEKGYEPADMQVAVVLQRQIEAQRSGLVFSRDPVNRYASGAVVEAILGFGENLVSGEITPERFAYAAESGNVTATRMVGSSVLGEPNAPRDMERDFPEKPRLADAEVALLAGWAQRAEGIFGAPQDMEWAYDDEGFWLLQSRPLVFAQHEERLFPQIAEHTVLARGVGVSPSIGSGAVLVLSSEESVPPTVGRGTVVVLPRLTNDRAILLRDAAGVVAEEGGATSHGANILREFDVPCVIGAGGEARALRDGQAITVDGFRGVVFEGDLALGSPDVEIVPSTKLQVFVSVLVPDRAAVLASRADGVSSLRDDYFLLDSGVHPTRLIRDGHAGQLRESIVRGLVTCSELFAGKPVWYKTMDAPTDEFRRLAGGYEDPVERNPLLGWRGIGRELAEDPMLDVEFGAIARAVELGCENLGVKLPFVRFASEYVRAEEALRRMGLVPHKDVALGVSVENPAVALGLREFLELGADFVSVGLSDLTMCTLALDRESSHVAAGFDPSHPAVVELLSRITDECHSHGTFCCVAGESARDERFFPLTLELGFDAIGVSLSYFTDTKRRIAALEAV
ncbi:MAG TPA: PEP/pyruvate-binding domain-containing protein [Coriobacteriia bacterium]